MPEGDGVSGASQASIANMSGFTTSSVPTVDRSYANVQTDISTTRNASIWGSSDTNLGGRMCAAGQLYDCGPLEGVAP